MKIKYWDKTDKKYVSKEHAISKNLRGIRRHCYITKDDLVAGNGLPHCGIDSINSDFVIIIKGEVYKLISPADNTPNVIALEEDWAGEVVMVEKGKAQGLLDVKSGELLIPYDKQNYAIYPLNKDFFCVVDPTLENKKIVNRKNQVIDSIHGTYVKSGNQLLRHIILKNGKYSLDGRVTLNSLYRKQQTLSDHQALTDTILSLKKSGMSLPELSKLVTSIYEKDYHM